jgi:hypothetical protein
VRLGRRIAALTTAVACGAVPFTWAVPPAGATDLFHQLKEFEVRYRNFDGQTITCAVAGESTLRRPDTGTAFEAFSRTFSSCDAFVFVNATYIGVSGERRRSSAGGLSNQATLQNDDVLTDYAVDHRIVFQDCAFDCVVQIGTRPK